jgi:hypothetical protein
MNADPRLRLLGCAGAAGADVLQALDDVRVVIRTGPDMTGGHTVALAAFIGMAARLFGGVVLEQPVALAAN